MKRISIISDSDIFQPQGVNYVTHMFLLGKEILKNRGYELYRLYDPCKFVECATTNTLPQFCENKNKSKSVTVRNNNALKEFIKKCTRNFLPFELIKYYLITYRRAKKTLRFFIENDKGISDIVIFQGYLSAYVAYRYYSKEIGFRSICIMHTGVHALDQMPYSYPSIARSKYVMRKLNKMVEMALKSVDHLVVLSQLAKESFNYICEENKTIIYNGIKENTVIKSAIPKDNKIRLVCVASLQERKGQHLLIEAMSKLPKDYLERVELNLIGSGNLQYYRDLANKYKVSDSVILWGNRSDIPQILSSMDVFILSSYGEGLPISIIEAMREGLYVMTSAVGGCPDMINEKMGCIIPLDSQGIADKLVEVINSKVYKDCSYESKKRFKSLFTLSVMINKYADLFDELSRI